MESLLTKQDAKENAGKTKDNARGNDTESVEGIVARRANQKSKVMLTMKIIVDVKTSLFSMQNSNITSKSKQL